MEKINFFIKLIPPRPSFTVDMTEAERMIMQQHIAYWKDLLDKNIAIVFGPVFDPNGGYGIGVVEVEDEQAIRVIMDDDPTIKSGVGFSYEIFGMRAVRK